MDFIFNTGSYLIFLLLVALAIILKVFFPIWKGKIGESRINGLLSKLGREYYLFHDIYLPKEDGKTTQVDHIVVSKFGIFVIETKNYDGWIYGNEKAKNWTQVIYKKKNSFLNPIIQNKGHIRALKTYLNMEENIYSIIVFSNAVTLKMERHFKEAEVVYNKELLSTIKNYTTVCITDIQLKEITNKLNGVTIIDKSEKKKVAKKHVQQIKTISKSNKKICRSCGSPLVKRTGKYGEFYGCSNFPKCRVVEK